MCSLLLPEINIYYSYYSTLVNILDSAIKAGGYPGKCKVKAVAILEVIVVKEAFASLILLV